MKMITKNCTNCNKLFEASIHEHNRGNAKFCCRSCCSQYTQKLQAKKLRQPNVSCALCGTEFYRNTSHQKTSRSGLFFCSRSCKDTAQRVGGIQAIQPDHYGSESGASNYRAQALRHLSLVCSRCNYDENEAALIVHHKDKDRTNNSLENLEILCCNCHAIEHWS